MQEGKKIKGFPRAPILMQREERILIVLFVIAILMLVMIYII
ncbi:MAG: hypothetical protein SCAL_001654 [Candidatus Syntrophoarchaeum caldarius]|uniref:Uncharacterized protein n=1 Tax=Candidatus Syntropharchaeum caldarium TaxID=1838285 RepID=A0A1F2P7N4_9EURY|nr:MAG: hypothetical protein SCAL_001654 [Candidatus Syntrophoarchaeum caldarius]